ncbi:MAG: deoxyribonuclease IV [Melioribacter sp.]|uniref:deoxyribonuclease IV n=1 Tax=Rosettibacter primus TaxID=3111523 RepID=UPI00247C3508|nr:deoxyribonuclease IV [Melioribacter sp.]
MKHLIGAHTFLTNGPSSAIDIAESLGFTAIQIFTKSNNQYFAKDLTEEEITNFKDKLKNSHIKFVVSHDSYLINLCAKDKSGLTKSRAAFIKELERCEQLGIPHLNFHPGAHGGAGEEDGLKLIAESLNYIHSKTKGFKVKSMLETTAGQGTALGYTFEQLRKIIDMVEEKERMSVCIDTCHIFAAGYNIKDSKEYKKVIQEFDEIIGLELLQCIHMNDSKKELGSKIDRHEHIGKGFIGLEGFANIMNDKKLERVPKILETPKEKDQKEDLENIKVLLSLIKNKKSKDD